MLEDYSVGLRAKERLELREQRGLEIDRRDRLLLAFWIGLLVAAHIVQIAPPLPRVVAVPQPFSTLGTVEKTREQHLYLATMTDSSPRIRFELLLHAFPKRSLHDGRLLARIDHPFIADLTYI